MITQTSSQAKAPLLTIITCIHQSNEAFLEACLKSIEAQVFRDFEHIINIGQVEKSTIKILREYRARNSGAFPIRFMKSAARGVAHALNASYPHANGKLIHFLHSDDYYLRPDTLERAVKHFERDESTAWVTGTPFIDLGRLKFRLPSTSILRINPARVLSKMIWISHENTFMKTELLNTYAGFDEEVKGPVEYRLWLRMIRKEKLTIVRESFTALRIHPESTSRGTWRAVLRSLKECRRVAKQEAADYWSSEIAELESVRVS